MKLPKHKFEVGSKHTILVGSCDANVKIGAKAYDEGKDAWTYYISGHGSCGKWSDWVNENFLIEHVHVGG